MQDVPSVRILLSSLTIARHCHASGTYVIEPLADSRVVNRTLKVHGATDFASCDASLMQIVPDQDTQELVCVTAEKASTKIKFDMDSHRS